MCDIEHIIVHDDPRKWSNARKVLSRFSLWIIADQTFHLLQNVTLSIIGFAAMLAGLGSNIQNRARIFVRHLIDIVSLSIYDICIASIAQMESRLHTSASKISWSISLYILVQGNAPLIWSAISEIKGRKVRTFNQSISKQLIQCSFYFKMVYFASIAIFIAGSIAVASSRTIEMVIGFRCLQAIGYYLSSMITFYVAQLCSRSSAVSSIGAATLADIFEPSERGTKFGIYYLAPLLV